MGWSASVIGLAAGGAVLAGGATVLAGCGGPARPSAATVNAYLARLTGEQVKLAAAERRIPRKARSPAALSRSISLLARAVGRLASDLQMIHPPTLVAAPHAELVAIAKRYYLQLRAAAGLARHQGEQRAGSALLASTDSASSSFAATATKINRTLGR